MIVLLALLMAKDLGPVSGRNPGVSRALVPNWSMVHADVDLVEVRGGDEGLGRRFMFHSLLRLGRLRRIRHRSSANRAHRDWPWRDGAWSRRGWESRDCRGPT